MESKKEGSECCSTSEKCCCSKALTIFLVFVLGAVVGYLAASHCSKKMYCKSMMQKCGMMQGSAPMGEMPATAPEEKKK